ncbi:MAG: FHA domain-containing protein [Acidimicrobiia bacterium]|nr:FHA domain-containing protein [Acidimicrobiia bacterium]
MSLRFDRFLVDDAGRRVLRDGVDIHLTPRAFELLLLLIARRPAAVAKSVIMETLWPGTFVLEANVANLVAEIRTALGDDASHSRFVRTVPRFGYAFAAEAAPAPGPGITPAGTTVVEASPTALALVGEHGRLPLPPGTTVLGREGVAAVLLNSPLVWRRHACIEVIGSRAFLEDLGSKNGYTVDGQRITGRVPLAFGARIGIGPVVVTLECEDEQATRTFHGRELQGL